ncbi:MAG: CarD family transcriptional regulator [Deltaproteobacteria bacterium]|nr:MAG: CarD family transcriptional regulator [Deltaproteobacteria bacterium]
MFGVGDMAVYPAHGVGEILAVESRDIMGSDVKVYVMRIIERNMTILIPVAKSEEVGLRPVMSDSEVEDVFEVLKQRHKVCDNQTWNRRFREYTEKIRTGSALEIAQVLRDLYLLRSGKALSYGEKRMLNTAIELLSQEIAVAQGQAASQAEKEILSAFGDVS